MMHTSQIELGDIVVSGIYGEVRVVGKDITGMVLVETIKPKRIPIWPFEVQGGYRDWVSSMGLSERPSVQLPRKAIQ